MANLYKRTDGSLVIANTPPSGGTLVTINTGDGLAINAPAYRAIDSSSPSQFHPAIYSTLNEFNLLDRPLQAKLDLIQAQVNTAAATISDTYDRLVTADTATVTRISSLESSYNANNININASFNSEISTRTNADTALATKIDLLSAAYGDNYANIRDTNTALATLTNSFSERTSKVESTLGSNHAEIKVAQSSVDGIDTTYAVTVNNNGSLSGFALTSTARTNSGVPTSAFVIAADKFAIVDPSVSYTSGNTPNSSDCPFLISGGVTYIKEANIQALTIGSDKLKNNSTSGLFYGVGFTTSSSWTATTEYQIATLNIPAPTIGRGSSNGLIHNYVYGYIRSAMATSNEMTIRLYYSNDNVTWYNQFTWVYYVPNSSVTSTGGFPLPCFGIVPNAFITNTNTIYTKVTVAFSSNITVSTTVYMLLSSIDAYK